MDHDEVMQDIINHLKKGVQDVAEENERLQKEIEVLKDELSEARANVTQQKVFRLYAQQEIAELQRAIAERDAAVLLDDEETAVELEAHGVAGVS